MNFANLSPCQVGPEGVVHPLRPMLSSKYSFTIDSSKSGRIEKLERMAEEVGHQKKDLSDDLPKFVGKDVHRALPTCIAELALATYWNRRAKN